MKHYPFAIAFSLLALPCYAGVGKISSPLIEKGVAEIEYSGTRYGDDRSSLNNKQNHTYEFEYNFTDRFMFGIEAESTRQSTEGSEFEGFGVEAQYELTNQGPWWLNSAVKGEYLHTVHSGAPEEVELQILASRTYGASSLTVNFGLEREAGAQREHGLALSSAVQAKHAYNEHFAPGLEWHADYGKLNNLGESHTQEHYIGPVVSGELFELGSGDVDYTVGYYWGLNDQSADNAARIQLGYEFKF